MITLRRALGRIRRDDRGTSIMEMMVVIALTTMILALTASTMIFAQRQAGSTSLRLDNSAQSRVGVEAMSKILRTAVVPSQLLIEGQICAGCGATMVTIADGTSITFYANVNNDLSGTAIGPSRVTYSIVQDPLRKWGNLVEAVQQPVAGVLPGQYSFCTPGAAGCPTVRSRIIARGLLWPAVAMFTYYDLNDVVLSSLPLSASNLSRLDSIDIKLRVRTSTAYNTPATTVVQRVALTNAPVPQSSASPTP